MLYPRLKISVSMDILVLGFYGYIGYIGGYFYMNIDITKIKKYFKIHRNTFKITIIIKYTH